MALHDKVHADNSTHPNSPYGTRSKVASSSTPNLSTLLRFTFPTRKAAKRWGSPGPSLPTVRSDCHTTTTTGGEWTSAREARDLSASGSSGKTAKVSAVPLLEKPLPLTHKKDNSQSYRLPCLTSLLWRRTQRTTLITMWCSATLRRSLIRHTHL